ncbi:kinesin motor domain-containing protein [Pycnococcus provasolii]
MAQDALESARSETLHTRMKVVVRLRPVVGEREKGERVSTIATGDGTGVQVEDASANARQGAIGQAVAGSNAKSYTFDAVLDESADQKEVFDACDVPGHVDDAISGYNVAIFAYGQTGSGKTHTLTGGWDGGSRRGGDGGERGGTSLIQKALALAYERIAQQQGSGRTFTVSVSFVEIYNDAVADLLSDASTAKLHEQRDLPVRHNKSRGFYVDGASQSAAPSLEEAIYALGEGLSRRHVRAHRLNAHSSRSHCLFTLHIDSCLDDVGPGGRRKGGRHGRITFVDLAGSERLRDTGSQRGEAVREAGHINRSLFHLGKVITALAQRRRHSGTSSAADAHVPYRDCALTKLLYDAMSGRGRATMIGCLSPTALSADESRSTLHFASLAMRLEAKPVLLLDEHDQLVADLRGTITNLKSQNKLLLDQLKTLQDNKGGRSARANHLPNRYADAGYSVRPKTGYTDETKSRRNFAFDANRTMDTRRRQPSTLRGSTLRSSYESALPLIGASPSKSRSREISLSPKRAWAGAGTPTKNANVAAAADDGEDSLAALEAKFRQNLSAAMEKDAAAGLAPARSHEPPAEDASGGFDIDALERRTKERLRALKAGTGASFSRAPRSPTRQPPSPTRSSPVRPPPSPTRSSPVRPPRSPVRPPPSPVREPPSPARSAPETTTSEGPDAKAVAWAQRNPWFGRDQEMTQRAYAEHDRLVGRLGVDPTSDEYYAAIEEAVMATFPHKFPPPSKQAKQRRAAQRRKADVTASASAAPRRRAHDPVPPTKSASAVAVNRGPRAGYIGHASKRSVNARLDAAFELSGVGVELQRRNDAQPMSRADVVASLQQMKAEAEADRKEIMAQIRKALNDAGV